MADTPVAVRPMVAEDWDRVHTVYAAGIASGAASFEEESPTWETFDGTHLPGLRFVAVSADEVVGWIAASAVVESTVQRGVIELGVYVDPAVGERGIGRLLLETLVTEAERLGVRTIRSAIFPENTASLALHERCGFRIVGTRNHIRRLRGEWRDILIVERRSSAVD